ncbi:uncharacterized protein TRUGW13939_07291 [Talaromyces rugulosus]|uniref:Rhodopsin domain-containing protein n=1 Tax=Talaromyces rugulosus TaxID=121627 RepID=A0A7H8R2B9_TALRU|nr:uncharacterized protein TRUGW13939_07291 [Talaromyces rugulosus]QKX60148.1 hypothetical protein TRUGW13939_07291 [Talaromyces rugulosus]
MATTAEPRPTFTPALKPPPGVISNPENPASLAYESRLTIGIAVPLVTIAFAARAYVRIIIKRSWIFEDWIAFVAWAGTVAYCGIMGATMSNHGGQHAWDITAQQAHDAAYWFNVASIEYGVMICITKLAILWLYRRFFSPIRWSLFDILIVSLIVILIGFYGITSFVKIFECSPRAKIFDKSIPGTCTDVSRLLNTSGMFNTITDYLILLLPVHAVWKLQLTPIKKLYIVLIFTFGLCAPVFSTIGFIVRLRISGNPDTTWNQPEILLWGAAELTSGNLVVCAPEVGTLLSRRARRRNPRRPTTSILEASAARVAEERASHRKKDLDSRYYELEEGNMYDARVSPTGSEARIYRPETGAVQVRHEITVMSERP